METPPMVAEFPTIRLGLGTVEIGDALHDGLPALFFGRNGQGVGVKRERNEYAADGETLAVVTFANRQGFDVLMAVLERVREKLDAHEQAERIRRRPKPGNGAPNPPGYRPVA